MHGKLPVWAAVLLGVVIWFAASFATDLAVLQVFPLSSELPEGASIREVLASRPNSAVALNLLGGLLFLALASFLASRLARQGKRAGLVVTAVIILLVAVNIVLTQNFRWINGVGLLLAPVLGYAGASWGSQPRGVGAG